MSWRKIFSFCYQERAAKIYIEDKKCDALRDLVPFIPLKKGEKHPWRNVNCYKWYQIAQLTTNYKITRLLNKWVSDSLLKDVSLKAIMIMPNLLLKNPQRSLN